MYECICFDDYFAFAGVAGIFDDCFIYIDKFNEIGEKIVKTLQYVSIVSEQSLINSNIFCSYETSILHLTLVFAEKGRESVKMLLAGFVIDEHDFEAENIL